LLCNPGADYSASPIYRNPAPGGYQSEIVVADNAAIGILAFSEIEISFSELFLPV